MISKGDEIIIKLNIKMQTRKIMGKQNSTFKMINISKKPRDIEH